MRTFDPQTIATPYYIVDEAKLIDNLKLLQEVKRRAGCKILLAQKAFSMYKVYPLIGEYLDGTTASGIYEARLGYEEMGKETHAFSPAYKAEEFTELLKIADTIVFNSFSQWTLYKDEALKSNRSFGMRVNPEHSTGEHPIYDPCSPGSRLGVTKKHFRDDLLDGIEGLHFHTLCEQGSEDLQSTLKAFEDKFSHVLGQMKWVNFGGGHHITKPGYNIDLLVEIILDFKSRYDVDVYLEPGEAIALDSGYLVASVLDLSTNDIQNAILDTSATCHMPDVLEMPYRPHILGSAMPNEKAYTYRLGGPTCLAGDIIGDYSFDKPLEIGDTLIFTDMAIYTMVKTTTFNGMPLPSIALHKADGEIELVKAFTYDAFKSRL